MIEVVANRTGIVSDYLRGMIAKQVDDHGLVVWFDPSRDYEQLVPSLSFDRTTVVSSKGSFFALRREIDGLLNGESPPRLVVYVPCTEEEAQDALIELTSTGVVLKPGQHPWQRNTRLSVVAKAALRTSLGEEQLMSVEKQVEQRQLSLRTWMDSGRAPRDRSVSSRASLGPARRRTSPWPCSRDPSTTNG